MNEEKIIEIHRKVTFAQDANSNDPETKAYFDSAFTGIGSYFAGNNQIGSGLDKDEKKLLMPRILDVESDERGYRKAVEDYFVEFFTKIPPSGLKLRVGLEDPKKRLSKDNLPLNLHDYLVWRHALGHPQVAKNKEEAEVNPIKRFYILDPEAELGLAVKLNELADKAMILYLENKDNSLKVDQVLTLMGKDIRKLNKDKRLLLFKSVSERKTTLDEESQAQALKQFVDACEDEDLEMKYLIREMIGAQVLEEIGSNILISDTGEPLGDSMEEAVLFLKNKKNSAILNMLTARLKEFIKNN